MLRFLRERRSEIRRRGRATKSHGRAPLRACRWVRLAPRWAQRARRMHPVASLRARGGGGNRNQEEKRLLIDKYCLLYCKGIHS